MTVSKRVLVFGMTATRGGVESFLMNVYKRMDHSKVIFDFLANQPHIAFEEELVAEGNRVYHIPMRSENPFAYHAALKSFFSQMASRYNAIWVNVSSLANIDYLLQAKKYGIPVRVVHCHNSRSMDSKLRNAMHAMNRTRIGSIATDYWTCSDKAAEWFYSKRIMKSPRYRLITNAVDASEFALDEWIRQKTREELGIDDSIVAIGHVGRFHPQKNHPFLLQVFQRYHQMNPQSVLLLIGIGDDMQKIKDMAQRMNLADSIQFLGERDDMSPLYQAMDLFLFPSLYEGLSVALVEAQAAGLPCVVSDGNPVESKINDNIVRLSLENPVNEWARSIEALKDSRLAQKDNKVIGSQYDTRMQSNFIEKFFEKA